MSLFRNLGILGILIALTGCSVATFRDTAEKIGKVAEKTNEIASTVSERVKDIDAKIEAMDKDGDGQLSLTELLLGAGTVLGVGGGTLARRNAKSDARKAVAEARLESLERRLPPAA